MESITKWKLAGIPVVIGAAVIAVLYYLFDSNPPELLNTKANTAGSGLFQYQQGANLGSVPAPNAGNAAVVIPPSVADSYWLYNVSSDINAALPPFNAPTGNPAKTNDTTVQPGNVNAYPWIPNSSNPDNSTPPYAASRSDQVNAIVATYGDIFSKSLVAASQSGYGPLTQN